MTQPSGSASTPGGSQVAVTPVPGELATPSPTSLGTCTHVVHIYIYSRHIHYIYIYFFFLSRVIGPGTHKDKPASACLPCGDVVGLKVCFTTPG